MSEMSAEKKKEIENYIVNSYFGGGKNVESLTNGADVVKGTDDGRIPQLIVEVTYFGESGIVMIKWNIYGDSHQNSFAMRVCREREIERNRCDSVDSMDYAWEAWKSRILNKPVFSETNDENLQKDKRIEELERTVKALRDEKEVMERRIRELESHNVSLAETNAILNNKLNKLDPLPEFKEILKKLYSTNDIENLEWTLNHVCGGRGSVNGWIAVSLFWKQKYETISKLVGFMTVEEIQYYLTNEAECETLYKAISKLKDQVKYTCDEWCKANSSNNSWKAAAECNSPKELIEKREALDKEVEIHSRALKEWKDVTGYTSPSAFKSAFESGASWCHAYRYVKKQNEKLAEEIKKWKDMTKSETPEHAATWITSVASACERGNKLAREVEKLKEEVESWKHVTGHSTPEDYLHARLNNTTPFDYTAAWQKATGCNAPDDAEIRIKALNERIDESEADYNHLLNLTGFESEGEIEDALDRCDHSTLRKALADYEFDYEALLKLTGYKSEDAIRVALNHGEQFVYENMMELIDSLKRKAEFTNLNWQIATGCNTPEEANKKLASYEERLDSVKQSASYAIRHLDNIVFRDDKRTDWSDK